MGKPRFRRTVVAVALLHGLLIGLLFYWSTREVRVQQAKVTWLNTSNFLPPETEEYLSHVLSALCILCDHATEEYLSSCIVGLVHVQFG